MTRTHEYNEQRGSGRACKDCRRPEFHPIHPLWLLTAMRTAEGKLVDEPVFHQQSKCTGDRAEKSLWFAGWWWWVCLSCGALWQGMLSEARYLRDEMKKTLKGWSE